VLLLSFENVEGCTFPARRLARYLPTKLLGYLSAIGSIKKELAGFHPDLVSALYIGGYGFVAARSGHRPLAVSSLGSDLLVDYPSSIIHRLQIRSVLRTADLVITDADELSRLAIEIGVSSGRILKAYMGIDHRVFFPRESAPGDPARESGPARIVSTRNLHPIYNVGLLVDAASIIRERRDALFIVCGDGPERERIENAASRLGLAGSFDFKGRVEPQVIARELRSADVYVSTSRSDSTSVSLLEAMACGATPIVTDIAANREWITDRENGRIIEQNDPRALAAAVIETLDDAAFRNSARDMNYRTIQERGLWDENMRRVEEAFNHLAASAPRQNG
jgi:glycosyltransferase involved in cell wall biosynthesis